MSKSVIHPKESIIPLPTKDLAHQNGSAGGYNKTPRTNPYWGLPTQGSPVITSKKGRNAADKQQSPKRNILGCPVPCMPQP